MSRHGADPTGVSRPASPGVPAGAGLSRPVTPDAPKAKPPPRQVRPPVHEMEPEPEPEGYHQNGNGRGATMNYVDLDYEDELTASMRPYSKLVHDVRAHLTPAAAAALRTLTRSSQRRLAREDKPSAAAAPAPSDLNRRHHHHHLLPGDAPLPAPRCPPPRCYPTRPLSPCVRAWRTGVRYDQATVRIPSRQVRENRRTASSISSRRRGPACTTPCLRSGLTRVSRACLRHSVRNQRENVLMLLGNILSQQPRDPEAVTTDGSWSRHAAGSHAADHAQDDDEYLLRGTQHSPKNRGKSMWIF